MTYEVDGWHFDVDDVRRRMMKPKDECSPASYSDFRDPVDTPWEQMRRYATSAVELRAVLPWWCSAWYVYPEMPGRYYYFRSPIEGITLNALLRMLWPVTGDTKIPTDRCSEGISNLASLLALPTDERNGILAVQMLQLAEHNQWDEDLRIFRLLLPDAVENYVMALAAGARLYAPQAGMELPGI